jgi:hypothetical protein
MPARSNSLLGKSTLPAKEPLEPRKWAWSACAFEVSHEHRIADRQPRFDRVRDVASKTGPVVALDTFVILPVMIARVGPPVPERKARRNRVGILGGDSQHLRIDVIVPFGDRLEITGVLRRSILPEGSGNDPCRLALRCRSPSSVQSRLCLTIESIVQPSTNL